MDDLGASATSLKEQIDKAYSQLKIDELNTKLISLKEDSSKEDFWNDNRNAQDVMKEISNLESRINPWVKIRQEIDEVNELVKLNDNALSSEIKEQLSKTEKAYLRLKDDLKFSGPYDDHNAILSLYAGAGGTDAQDWTQMLLRMYTRWCEKHNYNLSLVEESPGDEAGIKSVTVDIEGPYAYGKLRGEHGVHRLVRLSPYNSDNLRQTSFAKVEVMPKIDKQDDLIIDEKDLKIDVYRSGGHGGQSVNTTDSAVRITHIPSGVSVAIQNERSQLQNKETALTILKSKLTQIKLEQHKDKLSEIKGENQSAEWGNQIRNYVLHPYKQVKDLRTKVERSDPDVVLDGDIDQFINSYLDSSIS